MGLWYGRRMGYKEIESGNIRDCLYSGQDDVYSTWYVDKLGDLRCDAVHHDGTNHYLYRTYKDGVSESQIELLKENSTAGSPPAQTSHELPAGWATTSPRSTGFLFPVSGKPLLWKGRKLL